MKIEYPTLCHTPPDILGAARYEDNKHNIHIWNTQLWGKIAQKLFTIQQNEFPIHQKRKAPLHYGQTKYGYDDELRLISSKNLHRRKINIHIGRMQKRFIKQTHRKCIRAWGGQGSTLKRNSASLNISYYPLTATPPYKDMIFVIF